MADDDTDASDKKFTQADLDRIVQERLARVKPTVETPADYKDLQAAAKRLTDLEAKDKTDAERLQSQIDTLAGERDAAQAERDQAKAEAATNRTRSAVVAAAAKAKAVDPDDVFALLPKDSVTIGDDGQVTGVEEAVKALLDAKPHLVGAPGKPRPDLSQGARDDEIKPSVAAGKELFAARRPSKAG